MIIFSSDRFGHHLTPPGHPERPERAEVLQRVASRWAARGHAVEEPVAATEADLGRVHTAAHIAAMRSALDAAVPTRRAAAPAAA